MQTGTQIYSPASSLLMPKVIVIVSNRIRTPTFQTKLSHHAECDTQAGSDEALGKISLSCIMLKHICAEMVKRVRTGGKRGFYKTGLYPKYVIGVPRYSTLAS